MCLVASVIAKARREETLNALVAIFSSTAVARCPRKGTTKATVHPYSNLISHINHGKVLVVIPDEPSSCRFRKRHIKPKNIDTINKQLTDQRENRISADAKPTMAEYITIIVTTEEEAMVCHMLRKHYHIWYVQVGEIKATELRIDFKPDNKTFKYPPYLTWPNTSELE